MHTKDLGLIELLTEDKVYKKLRASSIFLLKDLNIIIVDCRTIRNSSTNCSIDNSSAFEFFPIISWSSPSGICPSARAKITAL